MAVLRGERSAGNAVWGVSIDSVALELDVVVGELAQLNIIDTQLFLLGIDTELQARDQVDQEENDAGENERPRETGAAVGDLITKLDKVSANPTRADEGGVECRNVIAREG